MANAKQKLDWTTVTTNDMSEKSQTLLMLFIDAKAELEQSLAADAVASGIVAQGTTFAYAYRSLPNAVGMAITGRSARATGFAGLKAGPKPTLADYQAAQDANGHSR